MKPAAVCLLFVIVYITPARAEPLDMTSQVALYTLPPFLLAFAFFFFVFSRQRREMAVQREKVELEMRALRAQINPHFIFNCLNSIHHFIQENETKIAGDYLVKFSYLMRRVLENSLEELVTVEEDLKILETYIQLEQMRSGHQFQFEINNQLEDSESLLIPPLILQPIVENAILHGAMTNPGKGKIDIEVVQQGKEMMISVTDNGNGTKIEKANTDGETKKMSLGSSITQDRLAAINKKENTQARIEIKTLHDAQGTYTGRKVLVYLPLLSAYD